MKPAIMFKSILLSLLLCLCLSSCNKTPVETSQASSSEETSTTESTTEEISTAESSLEGTDNQNESEIPKETEPSSNGSDSTSYADAVYQDDTLAVLDLGLNAHDDDISILPLGNNLLIASSPTMEWGDASIDTEERTVHLSLYDPAAGENLYETDITATGTSAYLVSITADGRIAVADSLCQYIQFLDETLAVQSTLTVPDFAIETVTSDFIPLETDAAFEYGYFTLYDDRNVYKVEMATGLVSVLYTAPTEVRGVNINSILFDGRILNISEYTDSGLCQRFITTKNGTELSSTTKYANIHTQGEYYYAILTDSNTEGRLVYGSADSKRFYHTMMLENPHIWSEFRIDQEAGTLLHYVTDDTEASTLQCYDLKEGTLVAKNDLSSWLEAEGRSYTLYSYTSGVMENHLYYSLVLDWEQQFTRLILWNPYKEPQAEDTYSKIPVLGDSAESDTEDVELDAAYADVRAFADEMEDVYHVQIRIAEECSDLNPPDYAVQYLTDVATIQDSLYILTEGLAAFPPGFFEQLKSDMYPEGLVIYLCGTLTGRNSTTLTTAGGITYTDNRRHVLALDCSIGFSMTNFYHETMHVIDNHINSLYFDSTQPDAFSEEKWSALNREDFSYTYDYATHDTLDTSDTSFDILLADSTDQIYFIDNYSKVSPMEDRARIFENAMFFRGPFLGSSCPPIQKKLEYICNYIRFHFDSEGWPDVPWEEALQ